MIDNSNNWIHFQHKLTDRQAVCLSKTFANNSSANENLSKTQISKIRKLGGFLVNFMGY